MANKHQARIENWRKITHSDGSFLVGEIYGHPAVEDGKSVHTSALIQDPSENFAETATTVYALGKRADA